MLRTGGKFSVLEERGLSILRINNVTDADAGTIKCLVKNSLTEIQREVQLELTGEQRAPTIIDKSKSAEINVGQTIEFFAKVSGAPMPTGRRKSIITVNRVRGTIDLVGRLMCVLTLKMRSSNEGQKKNHH